MYRRLAIWLPLFLVTILITPVVSQNLPINAGPETPADQATPGVADGGQAVSWSSESLGSLPAVPDESLSEPSVSDPRKGSDESNQRTEIENPAQHESQSIHQIEQQRMADFLDRVKVQSSVIQEDTNQLKQQIEQIGDGSFDLDLLEIPVSGPVSILDFDKLKNELAAAQSKCEATELEIETLVEMNSDAEDQLHDRESERRIARETAETSSGGKNALQRHQALQNAKLRSQLANATVQLRKAELENARCVLKLGTNKIKLLELALLEVQPWLRFTEADLQDRYAAIDRSEEEAKSKLARLNAELDQAHHKLASAQEVAKTTAGPATAEQVVAWQMACDLRRKRVSLLNQRLADLTASRICWDHRYRHHLGNGDPEKYRDDLQRATIYVERLQEAARVISIKANEARVDLATLRMRAKGVQSEEHQQWLVFQQKELKSLEEALDTRSVEISQTRQLLSRVIDETEQLLADEGGWRWLADGWQTVVKCWNFEVASIDDRPLTVKKITGGIFLFILGIFLARLCSRLLGRRILPRLGANYGLAQAMQSVAFYVLVMVFGFFVLEVFNVPLTVFTFMGGAVAIAAGFGSQNILNNFISGLILMAERPIRIGDLVEVNGLQGTIEQIGARSTRMRTGSNLELIIPNSRFLENDVTNWTLSDTTIRTVVDVGVAYGSPTRLVTSLLEKIIKDRPDALNSPEPIVLFKNFSDSALQFEIHFWIRMQTMMEAERIRSSIRHEIDHSFRDAGITIAFPQCDIHLNTDRPIELNVRQRDRKDDDLLSQRAA